MNKWLWFLILIPIIAGLAFLRWKIDQQTATDKLVYNTDLQKWEKYNKEDPDHADRDKYRRIAKAAKQLLLTL